MAPAGTPDPVISRLNEAFLKALRTPRIKEILSKDGSDAIGSTPQELAAYIRAEVPKWAVVVKAAGIRNE